MSRQDTSLFFHTEQPRRPAMTWADVLILLGVAILIYAGLRLALRAPAIISAPTISLAPEALPWYAALSLGRMAAAYVLAIAFSLLYGRLAAYNARAERVLIPLLDVLQSVPILSFLPVVLLGLSAILPRTAAVNLASIVLIFTSQAWNITFAWYQSLRTIPKELQEAASIFRFNRWLRFEQLELPFGFIGLLWNSMMSWAGGWFFLMAAEIFTVGQRDFRLPGLGGYLKTAADQGDLRAVAWGIGALVALIIVLDQLVWRPLIAWSVRFKLESVETSAAPRSWFYDVLRDARLPGRLHRRLLAPVAHRLRGRLLGRPLAHEAPNAQTGRRRLLSTVLSVAGALLLLYGGVQAALMLMTVPAAQWVGIGVGVAATAGRVFVSLLIALLWTVPVGIAIGSSERLARWLQPIVQIAASVPATALFPVLVLAVVALPGGLDLAAILLMLLGTQWYLLFNVIAGATAIPQDLKYTSALLQLSSRQRWRTLVLPALFPFIVTGAITAAGGAWNASIVAEYVTFAGHAYETTGIGSQIAQATAAGDYALLLAATLAMITAVLITNRLVWRRLYRLAEDRFRLE